MIDEFIEFAKELFRLITLLIAISILTLFLFGFIALNEAIINLFDLAVPLWGKIIRDWGMETFAVVVAILFLVWYFILGHPDLYPEGE
ncbi:MAG: hypothetical protein JSV92_01200 [archaeon]|nr:MAG: hypothetical protein JSV92_01200 [archaeon]